MGTLALPIPSSPVLEPARAIPEASGGMDPDDDIDSLPVLREHQLNRFSRIEKWDGGMCMIGGRAEWLFYGRPTIYRGYVIVPDDWVDKQK